jgi:PHD/YefM family antitoxin component YafN of YafNO toxin-antitoxin module
MDCTLPISKVRTKLSFLIAKIIRPGRRLFITKNGRGQAVLISPEELETLEIRSDFKLLKSILKAQKDIENSCFISHERLFKIGNRKNVYKQTIHGAD